MATLPPPKPKRQKREEQTRTATQHPIESVPKNAPDVVVHLRAADTGNSLGGESVISSKTTTQQLNQLVNKLLGIEDDAALHNFSLLTNPTDPSSAVVDITTDLWSAILKPKLKSPEDVLTLLYTPQAVFRVRPVSRCSASISGHGDAILATQFSPASSSRMVTGSGDGTARVWDCDTETPMHTLKGHKSWVLCVSWSPDASLIATGGMDNCVRVWDPKTGTPIGDAMKGHRKWITGLAWEPYHLQTSNTPRVASSSKDMTVRIWNALLRRTDMTLSGHTASVTSVKWGGAGKIYSTSQDKTLKIWDVGTGKLLHNLTAHAHWVNHIALSTEFALRTAYYDHMRKAPSIDNEKVAKAKERYLKIATVAGQVVERVVTASEDNTMYLWEPTSSNKPLARLMGHQKGVNHVSFSPDGRLIASASFDTSVRLWSAKDGKYVATLRGHVAPVYQCAFSADSRLLVSSSKDSTLKVWDVKAGKLKNDLPGHQDEVFAVDWSPDGEKVVSGGKDKTVRLWKY